MTIPLDPEPDALVIFSETGRVLLRLDHRAETLDGAVEDMGEAAAIFVNHVRAMLGMPAATPPTPPTDDVREALEGHLRDAVRMGIGWPNADYLDRWIAEKLDTILAEVRPRGTVADAEGAWEYGVRHVAVDGWPTERLHVSLEAACEDLDTCGMNCHLIRRRSARDAGSWETVDAAREARS